MKDEKVKYYYEEIKSITEGIGKSGLSEKLIEAAKEQDFEKMKLISRQFKKDNVKLWGRMDIFYEEYSEDNLKIFCKEKNDKLYLYDPNEIDPINLVALMALSNERLDDENLFCSWKQFQHCLEVKGYKEVANYISQQYFNSLIKLKIAYSY